MQRYLAPRSGFALFKTFARSVPVNRPVESPAAPHEKPLVLRTVFCSFRRLPAHTRVIGSVICSNSCIRSLNVMVNGFSTRLNGVRSSESQPPKQGYPPFHTKLPRHDVLVKNFWNCSMISYVEEVDGCDEACQGLGGQRLSTKERPESNTSIPSSYRGVKGASALKG